MAKLRQIINGVDPSTEKEEIVKEALSILINLAEEKVKGFIEEIKTDLLDGKLQDNSLKVPVTRVISQYEEYRAYVSENGDENYLLNNIIEGVNTIFSSSKDISGGISKILNSAFTAIMGAAEGEEQTKKIYFVVSEYPAIVRYDFALWNRTISSKGIQSHMKNALAIASVKSAVDITKLQFNDFLSIYGPILRMAYGEDKSAIKNMIAESKEIYSLLLRPINNGFQSSHIDNINNSLLKASDEKLADAVLTSKDVIYKF